MQIDQPYEISSQRRKHAALAILLVTVLWGSTFVWMKQGVNSIRSSLGETGLLAGIGFFMALRFGLAAVIAPLFLRGSYRHLGFSTWLWGGLLGLVLIAGFVLQMLGLDGVSAPVSAFLTSLYVLFTALISAVILRHGLSRFLWLGAVLATLGAGYISGPPQLHFDRAEWLTVGCAFVFAVHILMTDWITKRYPPLTINFTTMVSVALGSTVIFGFGLHKAPHLEFSDFQALLTRSDFLFPLGASSLLATLIALTLMNYYQRDLPPVRAAILYAIEPIWAAIFAIALGQSQVTGWLIFGGMLLLLGNLFAELGPLLTLRKGSR